MPLLDNPEFIAGLTTGAIIAATLFIVSAFRQLSLAMAAMAVIYVFATQGVGALAEWVRETNALLSEHGVFFNGAATGATASALLIPYIAGAERTQVIALLSFLLSPLICVRAITRGFLVMLSPVNGLANEIDYAFAGFVSRLGQIIWMTAYALVLSWRIATLSLSVSFLLSIAFLAISLLTNPWLADDLAVAHRRSSSIELYDAKGRWIGIVPPSFFSDWSDRSVGSEDHAAVPLTEIPPVWRTCIERLEDRSVFDGAARWLGIDPLAIVKSAILTATGQRRRGASTLYMQLVRSLHGQTPSAEEPIGMLAARKISELFGARALAGMLHARDPRAAERFIGAHLPLVIGSRHSGFGQPIHGVVLAARVLFGKSPAELSIEEQAVLAASVKTPVLLVPPTDRAAAVLATNRWGRIKDRADFCLRSAFPTVDVEIAAARARLARMDVPRPEEQDLSLRRILPSDAIEAWHVLVNPVRRALYFAGSAIGLVKAELDSAVTGDWRGRIVSVRLTISGESSRMLNERIDAELGVLQRRIEGLELGLTNDANGRARAFVTVAVADAEGRLQSFYSSRPDLFLSYALPAGSIAKIFGAVALGCHGHADDGYCRWPTDAVRDSRAERECSGASRIPARDAIARSDNLAIAWALRNRLRDNEAESVVRAFALPLTAEVPLSTQFALGLFEVTPVEMLRDLSAVGGIITRQLRDTPRPTIIDMVTELSDAGAVASRHVAPARQLSANGFRAIDTEGTRKYLSDVLSATSDDHGTLRRLAKLKRALAGRLYAKTGTVSRSGVTRAVHVTGVFVEKSQSHSFIVTIAALDPNAPLGRKLKASQFASLVMLGIRPSALVETHRVVDLTP